MATQKEMANQPIGNRILSGYEGANLPEDFKIPSLGIEDVDRAMFNLFDKDNQIYIMTRDDESVEQFQKKVPVVFATGERFALRERRNPIRDKSGALILPIISIRRTGINQAKENMGSAIGQDTGDFVIKKRLSSKDPKFQNAVNRLGLKNQENVASDNNFLNFIDQSGARPGTLSSRRSKLIRTKDGLLTSNPTYNITEVISIPFPIRYTVKYEITFWTSFQIHMNQMIEKVMTNYDGQGRTYKLTTDKGYYFVAYFADDIETQDNFEEFTDDERVHKYVFNVEVTAYMIANQNGGDMVPFRRYLSAPQISFGIFDGDFEQQRDEGTAPTGNPNDFLLNNIENLDNRGRPIKRLQDVFERRIIVDPFSGKNERAFVRIKRRDARVGETTISSERLMDIEIP
jgi:hypothetical protein